MLCILVRNSKLSRKKARKAKKEEGGRGRVIAENIGTMYRESGPFLGLE